MGSLLEAWNSQIWSLSVSIELRPASTERRFFFSLEFGRCRAKARSLHEHKLSKRRLYKDTIGPYEQANLSRITKKTHKTTKPRRPANPPARLAFHQRKQQNSHKNKPDTQKGPEPEQNTYKNRFAKGHSGLTTASFSKTCEQNELRTTTFKQTWKPCQLAYLLRHRCAKTVHEHGATTYASLSVLSDQLVQKASMNRVVTKYQPWAGKPCGHSAR